MGLDHLTEEERRKLGERQHEYTKRVTTLVAQAVQNVMTSNPPPDNFVPTGATAFIQACIETSWAVALTCRLGPKTFSKIALGILAALSKRAPPPGAPLIELDAEVDMIDRNGRRMEDEDEGTDPAGIGASLRAWAAL